MKNFPQIKDSLLKIHPFTGEQLDQFMSKLTFSKLGKKDLLLKPGQISDAITFISSGSLRLYTKTDQSELTIHFFTENNWVADLQSLLAQQPSVNYIEALEDTHVAVITLKDIHRLMDMHSSFRMLNGLLGGLGISTTHMASLKTQNPDERYRVLLMTHPDWINRFPQNQIASYLGMAPETLSRVRARLS